ncbi:uncharacterized protein [Henckelia pumila]|uniref:uncharacterized protein n=1 Tax=Henckelia pumila TaxID=405737 RepID=UPI003C6DCEA7
MDAEKQDAINVFLGYFQSQQGKVALWELDSDQHYNVGRRGSDFTECVTLLDSDLFLVENYSKLLLKLVLKDAFETSTSTFYGLSLSFVGQEVLNFESFNNSSTALPIGF